MGGRGRLSLTDTQVACLGVQVVRAGAAVPRRRAGDESDR
jgi:hypothetical protein